MGSFVILTNRRRAIIALVHSAVFLLVAVGQSMTSSRSPGMLIPGAVPRSTWILCAIYWIVSAILLWLFTIAGSWAERTYFGLCAASAVSGLLRTILGDNTLHAAVYMRVVLLASAVLLGTAIVRAQSEFVRSS